MGKNDFLVSRIPAICDFPVSRIPAICNFPVSRTPAMCDFPVSICDFPVSVRDTVNLRLPFVPTEGKLAWSLKKQYKKGDSPVSGTPAICNYPASWTPGIFDSPASGTPRILDSPSVPDTRESRIFTNLHNFRIFLIFFSGQCSFTNLSFFYEAASPYPIYVEIPEDHLVFAHFHRVIWRKVEFHSVGYTAELWPSVHSLHWGVPTLWCSLHCGVNSQTKEGLSQFLKHQSFK